MQQQSSFGKELIDLVTKHMQGENITDIFTTMALAEISIISTAAPLASLTDDEAFAYYQRVLKNIRTAVNKKQNLN